MLRIFAIIIVSISLAGIGGCKTSPLRNPGDAGAAIPARWAADKGTPQPTPENWVETFGDPNLSALVNSALTDNYQLKAVAARVKAAVAQARIDGAGRWPQLFFAPGYQYAQIREAGFGSARFSVFEALFSLSWELDVWGRISDFQQAAIREADATAADFQGARLSLAARVAQSYFELAEARLQAAVAEQSVKDRSVIVDLVRGRFARGLTKALDVRLALTDLANAEAELTQARNQVQILARRLQVLLGRYPEAVLTATAELPELPPDMPAGLPSELLERRPDLVAAYDRLLAADSRLQSTRKLLLPRVALTAAGGMRSQALTELVDPRALAWNVLIGLAQPVFTGGRIRGQIELDKAQTEQALNLYKDTALNAFREVEQALAADEWLRKEEKALRNAVEQTEASRKLAVYSYQHGYIEILTLLDSYRSTLTAQSAHLSVRRQLLSNRINLYLALGGNICEAC
ncbi:efflux transporter, outer membrane factor (OMF) lipoprotein, NodT family [Nitrosospira multiformis]|uniref:Efflux transporter, outer membrane factor (OMF) lipoprotein, NodT family n=1 Tax=Nitrosospira multiformis TaxID=1231 RepID=A0A1H8H8I9_9PROT|nr:efflux transporter outer membrane subunit [Nitrosospira multiformis]SEN52324.1 efflux transporter, outer membrane factor (OMF) lipoprotein, NodT family [Nitrosospira multiformis]